MVEPLLISPHPIADVAAMNDRLARYWWAMLLRGLFALLFGIITLLMPEITLSALVLLFAAYLVFDGLLTLIAAARAAHRQERWRWLIAEGVASLAGAVISLIWPAITVLVFISIVAVWAIVSGALLVVSAIRLRASHGRRLMGLCGAVSVLLGLTLAFLPLAGALTLTWWLGAYALVFGAGLVALSLRLHHHRGPLGAAGFPPLVRHTPFISQ